jgi:hypothetical protein
MKRFILGLVLGLALGAGAIALAQGNGYMLGWDVGYMLGWDVVTKDGKVICSDPYRWTSIKEIECD